MGRPNAKNNLKIAFWELYKTKPINSITIKEITDKAGYFRSTFYLYYDDIYHIYQEIEDELLLEWVDLVAQIPIIDSYDLYLENLIKFFDNNSEKIYYFLNNDQEAFKTNLKDKLYSNIDIVQSESSMINEYFISGMIGFFLEWYPHKDTISAKEAWMTYTSLLPESIFALFKK
ncbi:MAG: TetR/AcrR family transcriptional regulator [Erysipelotrichaceae bacterium]|nr:TetR/AcrR family transcriptional regulator [Erysipelotrichaceae bacterium]